MSYLLTAVLALSLALPAGSAAPAGPALLAVSAVPAGLALPAASATPAGPALPAISAVPAGLAPLAVQQSGRVWIGPDGKPLPFENDEVIVDFLNTAEILQRTRIEEGINRTWRLLMEKDGVRARAIFREVDILERNQRVGPIFFLVFRDTYMFDCAAYQMAVLLGMDNVPPAVLRTVNRTPGSVQLWIEGARKTDTTDFHPPNALDWVHQLWTMYLFDSLIYNVDRHPGNLMIDDDYTLWLIDHGRGFQRKPNPLNIDQVVMVDRRIWERLRELDEATITEAMGDYLDSSEVVSLMSRHEKLVDYIKKRIEELGEGSVLF